MKNTFLNKLAPKEPKFFPLLRNLSEIIIKVADQLVECVNNYDPASAMDYYHKIKALEKKGDASVQDIFIALNSTFITPFDREDIHNLAGKLDDVTDVVNRCAQSIAFYKPKKLPLCVIELSEMIKEGAEIVHNAINDMKSLQQNRKSVASLCSKLHEIENRADDTYQLAIMELFENEADSKELIKLKEIVRGLEQATDEADHVGKIVKTIIVKYA